MINPRRKTTSGASLMETVVYVSLVAFLSILVVQSLMALMNTFKVVRVTRDIENSAITSLDRITREIRQADALSTGGTFGSTTSKLILVYSGVSTTTREFSVDSNRSLRLVENGVDIGALSSSNTLVTTFRVDLATTSTKTAVRIMLVLKDNRDKINTRTYTFYAAAAMRTLY